MKHFGQPINPVHPPQPWEPINMHCIDCGHIFRAKTAGFWEALFKPKCPECGSKNTERDGCVIY